MLNRVNYQGRFTAKPELKEVGGFPMVEFTIAWSEKYKDNETKCFLRCKAWRNQAEHIVKFFDKGQECVIEGKLVTEEWETDGKKQSRTVCNIERIHFCGSKATNTNAATSAGTEDFMKVDTKQDEELPFG